MATAKLADLRKEGEPVADRDRNPVAQLGADPRIASMLAQQAIARQAHPQRDRQ